MRTGPAIVVRCDGSPAIGMGHVMRMTALALALRERGADVTFAMRPLAAGAAEAVGAAGFAIAPLPYGREDPFAPLGEADAAATREVLASTGARSLVVDHYGALDAYLGRFAMPGLRLGVLDELAERELAAAHWILNQNLGSDALPYRRRDGQLLLLGPSYALLREEFATIRAAFVRTFADGDARVLVTMGGGETDAAAAAALRGFAAVVRRRLKIDVAVGGALTPLADRAAAVSRHDVEIHRRPPSMAALMRDADVALSAGGSTSWELCAMALPMVLVVRAENQRPSSLALAAAGCAEVFDEPDLAGGAPAFSVAALLADPARRKRASIAGAALVDGAGCARVAAVALAT